MRFCSKCGSDVRLLVPEQDDRLRHVCEACGTVHYENPKLVVGCVAEWGERILMCRRAIEPRRGLWTLPAGFMEQGETTFEGARRETLEEALAEVRILSLFSLFNLPHIDQVYVMFRGRMTSPDFGPGRESLEVQLMHEEEIPWDQLAFASVRETLSLYFRDRSAGHFGVHTGTILPEGSDPARRRVAYLRPEGD